MKSNNIKLDTISAHSIKKFEIIEMYVKEWAIKLLQYPNCNTLIYIDCMSNAGEYMYKNERVYGSGPRVVKILNNLASKYPKKKIIAIFNDINSNKINYFKELISDCSNNIDIRFYNKDANLLLEDIKNLICHANTHYLLFYDPFDARIEWDSIVPYINNWGEVIINHMILDSIRAIKMSKSSKAIQKYEHTYQKDIVDLIPYGNDFSSYENRVKEIINNISQRKNCYIASFPFFNKNNSLMYDLIHITSNINGFKLFKKCAWKVFDGKSSNKKMHGMEAQMQLDLESNENNLVNYVDIYCYSINNIADYLYSIFKGKNNVNKNIMWKSLDIHPVFPTEAFKTKIINALEEQYGVIKHTSTIDFDKEKVNE